MDTLSFLAGVGVGWLFAGMYFMRKIDEVFSVIDAGGLEALDEYLNRKLGITL